MRRETVLLALAVSLAACGGDDEEIMPPPPGPTLEGTYALESRDGNDVPVLIGPAAGGCELWVTGGSLTLAADRTYDRTEVEELRDCDDPEANETRTVERDGTWNFVDPTLRLEENAGIAGSVEAQGTWDEDVIELTFSMSGGIGGTTTVTRTYRR